MNTLMYLNLKLDMLKYSEVCSHVLIHIFRHMAASPPTVAQAAEVAEVVVVDEFHKIRSSEL